MNQRNADSGERPMPVVLASRSEIVTGEWDRFRDCPFAIHPMGSAALKLALVAAGKAAATWTPSLLKIPGPLFKRPVGG